MSGSGVVFPKDWVMNDGRRHWLVKYQAHRASAICIDPHIDSSMQFSKAYGIKTNNSCWTH